MKKMEEFPETEKCDCQLASKQSPEITADSGKRNQKENTSDTQQQSDGIDEKGRGGMSQPVQNDYQCGICVEERADPGECKNQTACKGTVK